MSAYNTLDKAFPGLKYGIDSRVVSRAVKEANGLDFGRPVFGYAGNEKDIYNYHQDRSQTVFDADFVASNSIVATVNGTAVTAVVFDTDQATTITALAAQIEADIAGATATLTDTGGDNRTIVIDIDGVDVVVTWAITGGASQAGDTVTVSSRQVFIGIALFTQRESAVKKDLDGNILEAADAKYAYKTAANVMVNGWIYAMKGAVAVNNLTTAYVIKSGATQGKLTNDTNAQAISGVVFDSVEVSGTEYVRVRINK